MIGRVCRVTGALMGFVLADAASAVARDLLRPRANVIDRLTSEPVDEPRPLIDHVQLALVWTSFTGSRVLCRLPFFLSYLRRLTVRVGETMDAPASRDRIASFVRDNGVEVEDLDRPIKDFATLNDFFTRPLRVGARPLAAAGDPRTALVPADGRLLCSARADADSEVDVKAYRHDIAGLLGARSSNAVGEFYAETAAHGFAVATCRLAPGDYHRFHWPVDATWDPTHVHDVEGEYHSVAPAAVNSVVDVLGRNRRKVVIAHSEEFGQFAIVVVGALKVASIELTSAGGSVHRGDEFGVFAYGGSTVVLVFASDAIAFDADLVAINSTGAEARVQMGQSLGIAPARRT